MKTIVDVKKAVGGDGAEVEGGLFVSEGKLIAKLEATYPVAKVVDAVVKPLEPLREKLKAAIPGDWDSPIIDKIFDDAKALATKILSE